MREGKASKQNTRVICVDNPYYIGGIGTAGVPSGSIPFIIVVLATIGINPSLIALIIGVDRLLDMCRTTVNVTGDLTAATYVARSEGYRFKKW